ncbi:MULTISPECIES: calcium-binding protein [Mameliella]|uniref:calcium-binding protein n=1 Tax=Mameliella TaxID=1434019 RepID=UPI000B5371BD|nr:MULTISPECIES: calcium-binding protein [Mameliella]MCR9276009.1 calcium-binding protein [Paracoccaceae bacterium]OWV56825.1 hypothetical protein CDZ98_17585 [Mameliella alba]
MAILTITVDDVAAGDRILPASFDTVIISDGVIVGATGTGGDGIYGFGVVDVTMIVNGVLSGESTGAKLGAGSSIAIGANGTVSGYHAAIYSNGDGASINNLGTVVSQGVVYASAIYLNATATDNIVSNGGSITSATNGVRIEGTGATITNSGILSGVDSGILSIVEADIDNSGSIMSSQGSALDFSGANGDVVLVNSGLISSELTVVAITGGGNSIVNAGMMTSDAGGGIALSDPTSGTIGDNFDPSQITNTPTGVINAEGIGISTEAPSSTVINDGQIISRTDQGVAMSGAYTTVLNNGVISAFEEGVVVDGFSMKVINNGEISSTRAVGVTLNTTGGFGAPTSATLINNGTITSGETPAPPLGSSNIFPAVQGALNVNAIDIIVNRGVISGNVDLDDGGDRISNSGEIIGDVNLEAGNDLYRGIDQGAVSGDVLGGTGNDTLLGSDGNDSLNGGDDSDLVVGHSGNDTLLGEAGNDTLFGGAGDDSLDGSADNDVLNSGAGNDTVYGGTGNDALVGQGGSDFLNGGDGLDTIDGGNGDDVLEGGADNDILRGRAGEDELAGGLGRDFLTGGQDADQFVFRALAETVVGANRDQILDFEQGVDSIVVAGLSPGVFEFRGTAAFAPSGNPELRLLETSTGSTIVQFDADGNGSVDAEIRVAGVTGLTADDFVL